MISRLVNPYLLHFNPQNTMKAQIELITRYKKSHSSILKTDINLCPVFCNSILFTFMYNILWKEKSFIHQFCL